MIGETSARSRREESVDVSAELSLLVSSDPAGPDARFARGGGEVSGRRGTLLHCQPSGRSTGEGARGRAGRWRVSDF